MKKILNFLGFFNGIWGGIFFLLQVITVCQFQCNGHWDTPMSKAEYVQKGGNAVDYYAGYAYFTSDDSQNYSDDAKYEFDIASRTMYRVIYLLLYPLLWFFGVVSLLNALSWRRFLSFSPEEQLRTDPRPEKPNWLSAVLISLMSAISLYGIYYSVVYIQHFWMQ